MRTVHEVLIPGGATIGPRTTFKQIVAAMNAFRTSALPVVDSGGHYLGMVTEDDVLMKEIYGPLVSSGESQSWRSRVERAKAGGVTAEQIMSRAPTVGTGAPLWEVAALMHDSSMIRLAVVDASEVFVGTVTWRDLLSVYLQTDETLLDEITVQVGRVFPDGCADVHFQVRNGIVRLQGELDREEAASALLNLIGGIEGVITIDACLTVRSA